jgi:hypothetical protein
VSISAGVTVPKTAASASILSMVQAFFARAIRQTVFLVDVRLGRNLRFCQTALGDEPSYVGREGFR